MHVVEGIQSGPSTECIEGNRMMVMVLCREQHTSGQQTRQEDQQRVEDEVCRVV